MVVPNRHVASLAELSPEERAELMDLTARAEVAVTEVYRPHGLNIGVNLGKAAGAGIADHLHVHVVPRWTGDTNFMSVVGNVRVLPEEVPASVERLRPVFLRGCWKGCRACRSHSVVARPMFCPTPRHPHRPRRDAPVDVDRRDRRSTQPGARALVSPIAGGHAVFAGAGSPANKAIGVGFGATIDEAALDAIEREWRDRGEPMRFELSTLADPSLAPLLTARGYRLTGFENVSGRAIGAGDGVPELPPTAWPSKRCRPGRLAEWMDVALDAFGAPDGSAPNEEQYPRELLEAVLVDFVGDARLHTLPSARRRRAGRRGEHADRRRHRAVVRGGDPARVPASRHPVAAVSLAARDGARGRLRPGGRDDAAGLEVAGQRHPPGLLAAVHARRPDQANAGLTYTSLHRVGAAGCGNFGHGPPMSSDNDTLESWKEIAAYLKRDVTTVQRWEKREGLPVHRHLHDKSGSVFALKPELDRWRRARTRAPDVAIERSRHRIGD